MCPQKEVIRALPDLLDAQSIDQVKGRIHQSVSAIGFDFFMIALEGSAKPFYEVATNYPQNCVERYNRLQWVERDPVVRHCVQSPVPMIWHRQHFSGEAIELHEESSAHGIVTGVATALRGARHSQAMMISVASGAAFNARVDSWLTETMPIIQLLASYAYEAVVRIEKIDAAADIRLTPREGECLHWAAVGKTSWEISRILSCSEATVNFHFRNIIHKLGVSNRRQAVARALSLGLIRP